MTMMITTTQAEGPHGHQQVFHTGARLEQAGGVMVMIHGRGGSAPDILSLAGAFARADFAYLAPQAAGHTWYPYRFLEPTARNQPHLASALDAIASVVEQLEAAGVASERIILLGFSQGACLATEFAARNPRRWGGVVGLSGGLIGTDAEIGLHRGDLAGTPVVLGCSDVDPHIPLGRVQATTRILTAMKAVVDETIYPGMGHGIVEDEVERVRHLIDAVASAGPGGA